MLILEKTDTSAGQYGRVMAQWRGSLAAFINLVEPKQQHNESGQLNADYCGKGSQVCKDVVINCGWEGGM